MRSNSMFILCLASFAQNLDLRITHIGKCSYSLSVFTVAYHFLYEYIAMHLFVLVVMGI